MYVVRMCSLLGQCVCVETAGTRLAVRRQSIGEGTATSRASGFRQTTERMPWVRVRCGRGRVMASGHGRCSVGAFSRGAVRVCRGSWHLGLLSVVERKSAVERRLAVSRGSSASMGRARAGTAMAIGRNEMQLWIDLK